MKYQHNQNFDSEFSKIKNLKFYPYVGEKYGEDQKRIMVYAHNIPVPSEKFEAELLRTKSKTHFADALSEYTFIKGDWTKSFRNFIKGTLGLDKDYSKSSDVEIINKIDEFVEGITYTNFINGLVKSETQNNAKISEEQRKESITIQNEIIQILNSTHCIAWGKNVFEHILEFPDFEVIETKKIDKIGFGYVKIQNKINLNTINVLKVFHPSMPSFGQLKSETHDIFKWLSPLKIKKGDNIT